MCSQSTVYQRKSCVISSHPDCVFQEEEKDCQIVQITGTCRMNEFECSPNVCIHESWVCDGKADCRDGADEAECHQCRPDTKFQCLNWECIDRKFKCNRDHVDVGTFAGSMQWAIRRPERFNSPVRETKRKMELRLTMT